MDSELYNRILNHKKNHKVKFEKVTLNEMIDKYRSNYNKKYSKSVVLRMLKLSWQIIRKLKEDSPKDYKNTELYKKLKSDEELLKILVGGNKNDS